MLLFAPTLHFLKFFQQTGCPLKFLVGLYMMFGRFITDAAYRTRTYYGLTDRRVIILSGYFKRKIESLPLKDMGEISLSTRSDGSGTIIFEPNRPLFSLTSRAYYHSSSDMALTKLEFVADADTEESDRKDDST